MGFTHRRLRPGASAPGRRRAGNGWLIATAIAAAVSAALLLLGISAEHSPIWVLMFGGSVIALPFLLHHRFVAAPAKARALAVAEQASAAGWQQARTLMRALAAGLPLTPLDPGPAVLYPGEEVHLRATAQYARHLALNVSYVSTAAVAGTGAVGLGLAVGSIIGNSIQNARIREANTPMWRLHQAITVLVTNYGLIACTTTDGVLRFDWSAVSAFYPEPHYWRLVLEYHGDCAPLMLSGYDAPLIAVYAAAALRGAPSMAIDPAFAALR